MGKQRHVLRRAKTGKERRTHGMKSQRHHGPERSKVISQKVSLTTGIGYNRWRSTIEATFCSGQTARDYSYTIASNHGLVSPFGNLGWFFFFLTILLDFVTKLEKEKKKNVWNDPCTMRSAAVLSDRVI